ncbi:MAG: hypothetical protein R6V19_17375 [Armatimonadota bacterium]
MAQISRTDGFADHGVAAPTAISRGTTATMNSDGQRLVLIWLRSHDDIYQLAINIDTEEVTQIDVSGPQGAPFAVLHSSRNLWYGHFSGHLYEFDPDTLNFTFTGETPDRWAGALTEAPDGGIWGILNPDGHLISFNPDTRELTDHGVINEETWVQIPRSVAADDKGWIYAGTGKAQGQVIGYNPATEEIRRYVPEEDRAYGLGIVFRGTDGMVYAKAYPSEETGWGWHQLSAGEATAVEEPPVDRMDIRKGSQSSIFRDFGDGSRIAELDVPNRLLVVEEADGTERRVKFDYECSGARITSMASGPYDNIYGSTCHVMRFFSYDPVADELIDHGGVPAIGNGNLCALDRLGQHVYGAHYSGGGLWQIDPVKPWQPTAEGREQNPRMLARWPRNIMRPRTALAHPDGRHVLIAGYATDGLIGGGIGIYNLETGEDTLLNAEDDLLPGQSCITLKALPDGNLIGGTDVHSAWADDIATEAELFIIDWDTKKLVFRTVPVPSATSIISIEVGVDGLVYGLSGNSMLFVFDPQQREVVYSESFEDYGNVPRHALHAHPAGQIYALMTDAIVKIEPGGRDHRKLTDTPVGISAGGALQGETLYFASATHVWSYEIPDEN